MSLHLIAIYGYSFIFLIFFKKHIPENIDLC